MINYLIKMIESVHIEGWSSVGSTVTMNEEDMTTDWAAQSASQPRAPRSPERLAAQSANGRALIIFTLSQIRLKIQDKSQRKCNLEIHSGYFWMNLTVSVIDLLIRDDLLFLFSSHSVD